MMHRMTARPNSARRVLVVLVIAQLAGTSPWFAVNAVMPDLQHAFGWAASDVGPLSAAVQWGFIAGTLAFALLAVADRFDTRRVFLLCALASAACTAMAALSAAQGSWTGLWAWRCATGFFLAGIYPVGMKIASQWFAQGLGAALGLLVGALVLGSASAHALRAAGAAWPWASVFIGTALASAAAGVMVAWLPPAPVHGSATARGLSWAAMRVALGTLWTDRRVRASVFGYFGHMWELYTVWVLVPAILATRLQGAALSWAAFAVLGAGALGCAGGGALVSRWGGARVAGVQLALSGLCCLAAPWMLGAPSAWFALWLVVWGITVAGDSPQFSALTAANAPRHAVGSVLTLTNCIGFAISALSIEAFVAWSKTAGLATLLPWLALGPALGLWAMAPLLRGESRSGAGGSARSRSE
jgi:MFS transporter, DHA1 family, inner membrane transport protein